MVESLLEHLDVTAVHVLTRDSGTSGFLSVTDDEEHFCRLRIQRQAQRIEAYPIQHLQIC